MNTNDEELLSDFHENSPDAKGKKRRALAKIITLIESTLPDHRVRADNLLNALIPESGKSLRIGISGVPGVGKSTFIETLGLYLIAQGHRVAVLAIDPSSSISGGSILGDKTRMEQLSTNEQAFIRPSPSSGNLGGVAEKTRETMLIAEAAGYDIVLVETVGVGQSEIAVANMTDMFVLLQLPNAGDDLQAIKKGIMEIADLVVINKADLDPLAAGRAEANISGSLSMPPMNDSQLPVWIPKVLSISALKNQGIDTFWTNVMSFKKLQSANGNLEKRRQDQAKSWMWERIEAGLKHDFRTHPDVARELPVILQKVNAGQMAPSVAARHLLDYLKH